MVKDLYSAMVGKIIPLITLTKEGKEMKVLNNVKFNLKSPHIHLSYNIYYVNFGKSELRERN